MAANWQDDTRHWRSKKELDFWNPDAKNVSLYFSVINRNKRSMVLDLKSQHGKDILLKLVKGADVLYVPDSDSFRRTGLTTQGGQLYSREDGRTWIWI